jgi:hypothetical protein
VESRGDSDSIRFSYIVGLNHAACSPFRVLVSRLEAGRLHQLTA